MSRLPTGGLVNRNRSLSFRFDGREYEGFAGDTLASALLANGVTLVGRSFKYHRPRGILTAGMEEPSALVTLRKGARAEPNLRATRIELYEGLEAFSQNCWPSPNFDVMAVNRLFSPIFVAGFYYKTFMWPARFWEKLYEPIIRRAAGLGRLSGEPDPDHYDHDHAFADVLVVGGGPAGLSAALAAGHAGARVVLVEDDELLGGRLLSERGQAWAARAAAELLALPNVRLLTRTTVVGAYDGMTFAAVERVADHLPVPREGQPRQRFWKIVASRAILATGAIERPIAFGGNDRPGVMMASAIQTYVNRFGAVPGKRAAIFAIDDSGHDVASDLVHAGADVVAIVDPRANPPSNSEGIPVLCGEVVATHGKHLKSARIRLTDGTMQTLEIDLLGMAGGWNPSVGLLGHLGVKPTWREDIQAFAVNDPPPGIALVGAADGTYETAKAIECGRQIGLAAWPPDRPMLAQPCVCRGEEALTPPLVVADCPQKGFVDFQNDVTVDDVLLAEREGYRSIEHMKRYTTLGMATDQGKASQILGHAALAAQLGRHIAEIGTIASRPPYMPVALGAIAGPERGEHLRPVRHTPTHEWARANGADFVDAGLWKRARWYTREGDADWFASVQREARAVRSGVGLCDVSTLGKIELCGPDAGTLLDRLYANAVGGLKVGRSRYGIMLREDGFLFDDGAVARLEEERWVLTTTTANAANVMRHVDFALQVLWPELDVQAASVSEQWAQVAVAGPASRALLGALLVDEDVSNEAVPFMAARCLRWENGPLRLFRLSFSGELAYELAVPARQGGALMRRLMQLGEEFGVTPYGTEALGVLRIEKGHVAGGEMNGQVTAFDLGLGGMLSKKKDFIGRAMAERETLNDPARPRLVGLRSVKPGRKFTAGSHLFAAGAEIAAANDAGHVSSVCHSPEMGCWIGLGLLAHGPERIGERIVAASPVRGASVEVEVCDPVFVDPKGERLRG